MFCEELQTESFIENDDHNIDFSFSFVNETEKEKSPTMNQIQSTTSNQEISSDPPVDKKRKKSEKTKTYQPKPKKEKENKKPRISKKKTKEEKNKAMSEMEDINKEEDEMDDEENVNFRIEESSHKFIPNKIDCDYDTHYDDEEDDKISDMLTKEVQIEIENTDVDNQNQNQNQNQTEIQNVSSSLPTRASFSSSFLLCPLSEEEEHELKLSSVMLMKKPTSLECTELKNIQYKNSVCSGKPLKNYSQNFSTSSSSSPSTSTSNSLSLTSSSTKTKKMMNYGILKQENSSFSHLQQILAQEKVLNKTESWSKLNKTLRNNKLQEFVELYGIKHELSSEQIKNLSSFLLSHSNNGKFTKNKDVIYDKTNGQVKEIPNLIFNRNTNHFTLKQNIFIDHSDSSKTKTLIKEEK